MVTPIQSAAGRLLQVGRQRRRVSQPEEPAAVRIGDNGGGSRVTPRCGDEEETSVEARTSDDEDRRQNRSEQRSYG
jgi:hypothetical protein